MGDLKKSIASNGFPKLFILREMREDGADLQRRGGRVKIACERESRLWFDLSEDISRIKIVAFEIIDLAGG